MAHPEGAGTPQPPVPGDACSGCGLLGNGPALGWSLQVVDRRRSWLCGDCTRRDVRTIEARLDLPER